MSGPTCIRCKSLLIRMATESGWKWLHARPCTDPDDGWIRMLHEYQEGLA